MNPLDLLTDYTYTQALLGTVIIGICAGALGPLVLVQRQALIADAISHSSLLGLLGAFLVLATLGFDGRNPLALIAGSIITGLVAVAIISAITNRTVIHRDAAMAATLTTFFSLGMLLLQYISRNPIPGKAGIQDYLLGNASTLTRADVISALVIGGGVLLILSLIHHKQSSVVFDAPFAQLAGLHLNTIRALGFFALVAITVIGVKVVGVVLMVAVVIAPAVAARQWSNRLLPFIFSSAAIGGASASVGTYLSIAAGETAVGSIPTGPAIVLVQALIAAISLTAKKVRTTHVFSS
ncbi:metal ABC transporter permease [Corynebacterium sp. L4756]|uniref:metal ABC transporter permease n=1 Tax=unclassified Corynebacterium TaxID=2624378 RepID=UPI00374CDDD7